MIWGRMVRMEQVSCTLIYIYTVRIELSWTDWSDRRDPNVSKIYFRKSLSCVEHSVLFSESNDYNASACMVTKSTVRLRGILLNFFFFYCYIFFSYTQDCVFFMKCWSTRAVLMRKVANTISFNHLLFHSLLTLMALFGARNYTGKKRTTTQNK